MMVTFNEYQFVFEVTLGHVLFLNDVHFICEREIPTVPLEDILFFLDRRLVRRQHRVDHAVRELGSMLLGAFLEPLLEFLLSLVVQPLGHLFVVVIHEYVLNKIQDIIQCLTAVLYFW